MLVVVAIVALAFNLRPAAVSVGPVLGDLRADLGLSGAEAGLLTTLPVLAFAVFGALAPRLARAVGPHRLTLVALLCVAVGLGARSRVDHESSFLLLSLLALAGMATGNVVLPSLVKLHFPDRIGLLTSIYTTALAVGLTSALTLTVPVGEATGGGWRDGLLTWALVAAVAAVPWIGLVGRDRRDPDVERPAGIGVLAVGRTPLGRRMSLFFGLQSLQAYAVYGWFGVVYRDAGFSATTAGVLLGVIGGLSIPLSLLIPWLVARTDDQRPLMVVLMTCYPLGYAGLVLAPVAGAWLWAVLVGIGLCAFPLILTLIGLRARTPEGTAALSGWAQSVGYLLAAVGPFGMGVLHDATGSWTVPLLVLLVLAVPQLLVGLSVARPAYVEDQLEQHAR
ncbi:MFS transporter, CP family, cyanate transporter [Nocardioides scoriae]|uniref:MFS transporter, CP family, cyanate transporter n=1 Tax=Nocardioides scoriae TaxID=642780 RepID=A0A1H1LVY9_9ACTN|nr:MFS transporter, CP family, cyanate transporter [Nocardioides scoriae]